MRGRALIRTLLVSAAVAVAADAAVLRVGPGGDVATIQAGIDAALATPEGDELRVRAGTWSENLVVAGADLGGALEISGGWDATWTSRDPDPAATVIDGGGTGRVLEVGFASAGALTVRGLSLENGRAASGDAGGARGAGLYVLAVDIPVVLEDCRLRLNQVQASDGVAGAGAAGGHVLVAGAATLTVDGLVASGNSTVLSDTIGAVVGAGLGIVAQGTATATVTRARCADNTTTGPGQQRGAGLALEASSSATIEVTDSMLTGNHGSADTNGTGLSVSLLNSGAVDLRRLVAAGNRRDGSDPSEQLYLRCFGDCTARLSDSLVADGGAGVVVEAVAGVVDVVNVTLTAHSQWGIFANVSPPGLGSFDNSIAWANTGGDALLLGGGITQQANLIGVDPLFVAPAAGIYRPRPGSPARDAGTGTPTGGLSTLALGGVPRLGGPAPDQGAHELGEIFADGFESGDTTAWSSAAP